MVQTYNRLVTNPDLQPQKSWYFVHGLPHCLLSCSGCITHQQQDLHHPIGLVQELGGQRSGRSQSVTRRPRRGVQRGRETVVEPCDERGSQGEVEVTS